MRQQSPWTALAAVVAFACAAEQLVLAGGADKQGAVAPEAERFFETKVRPVLAENCFRCHGDKKQKGDLRLDSRGALLAGGEQGPVLVPGQPEKSLLIQAISHATDLKMPPSKKLTAEQISDLTQWVKMGAPWPGSDNTTVAAPRRGEMQVTDKDRAHWAFQPVKRPPLPAVKDRSWVANPIDAFLLAKLEAKGLQPNPQASKQELIRRVHYDLTGLPPTPPEVEAFVADLSPTAYEALVDRLLSSPRYGEKWGRHWLDLVRFAETNSYERDNPKPHAWRYRDYVIRAFNADKSYDRFVREQLAGDELPDRDNDSLIATGYYRLGIWDDEPSDRDQARYDGLDDILATTSQVFLGLTVDCARCHDHKLDPIPQKDYYRLLSFFHNINHYRNGGPTDEAPLFFSPGERKAHERRVRALEPKIKDVQEAIAAVEKDFRVEYARNRGSTLREADLDDLHYRYYRDTWNQLPDFDTLKPEDMGRLSRQLFDLSPRTRNAAFGFVFEGVLLVPESGRYTFYLDSDDGSRLSVAGRKLIEYDGIHGMGKLQQVTVELPQGRLPIRLDYFQRVHGLGLYVAWSGPGFARRTLSASEVQPSPTIDAAKLILKEGPRLLGKERIDSYRKLKKDLETLKQHAEPSEKALCVTEAGTVASDTFVLVRGNPQSRGDKVEPAFPLIFNVPPPLLPRPAPGAKSSGRRLALADWLASGDNPLTARVMANRIWQYHFGRGIVRSANNFGVQGDRPTHPELLDWLASEFVRQGWQIKPLHRLIVTSNAYRMSSRANPQALAADPANDLLWRFDMRRLSAEEVRDSVLAVSGCLNLKMYGPGVYPEISKEVMAGQSIPGRGWGQSPPEEQDRRSVYVHVKRSLLTPILEVFDAAETDRSTPVRFSTTQPAQALAMLNGEFLNQQAGLLAERLRREAGKDAAAQVRLALYLTTARQPGETDVRRGVELMQTLTEQDGVTDRQALQYFCLVALNLNEFINLD